MEAAAEANGGKENNIRIILANNAGQRLAIALYQRRLCSNGSDLKIKSNFFQPFFNF